MLKGLFHYFGQSATELTPQEKLIANTPEYLKDPVDEITAQQKQMWLQREHKAQQDRNRERMGKGMNVGRGIDAWRDARK